MLRYSLIRENEQEIWYEYFPEGNEELGIIIYNKKTKQCSIKELSTKDQNQRYALKMFSKIRQFAKQGVYEQKGIVVWG